LHDFISILEQFEAERGDVCPDDAAVLAIAFLLDELVGFEAGEQAGDVGLGGDHAIADGGAGEAFALGAAKDAEDVVLGGGEAGGLEALLNGALQSVGGAHELEEGFFVGIGGGRGRCTC
jgi:hypothetical protein